MMARSTTLRLIPPSIWALGGVSMLMDISSELIHGLLPVFLVATLGSSAFSVGLIEGAAEATALIVKMFSGTLSDALGKRKVLVVCGYGLGALAKPLFALATGPGFVLTARLVDRVGKGIRGAPRDALIADLAPPHLRGACYGLRQSLDTVGAFVGPLLAIGLMLAWAEDIRAVFWVAVLPAVLAVALLVVGVEEPRLAPPAAARDALLRWDMWRSLGSEYWWVVAAGGMLTLARFSEAFLILRAQQGGLTLAWAPLVLVCMNVVYALAAYPAGKLADRMHHRTLLGVGLVCLLAADLVLAQSSHLAWVAVGVGLWGLHMGLTQGLLATMVADTAPEARRGTAFGCFNLVSGLALLIASALAGWLWDTLDASVTFYTGALFALVSLGILAVRRHKPMMSRTGDDRTPAIP